MTTLTAQEMRDAIAGLHPHDKIAVELKAAHMAELEAEPVESLEVGIDRVDRCASTYGFHAIIRLNLE